MNRSPLFATHLATAHTLADAAGKAIRPHFRKPLVVDDKRGPSGFDPVTVADRAAERAILRHLAKAFPDHGIVGEEFGVSRPDATTRWIIDPIDGTRAFIMGLPTWGTLIGLADGDTPVLGLMNQPFTGERFWSTRTSAQMSSPGRPSRRLKTRACPNLSSAVFSSTHPDLFLQIRERAIHDRLKSQARMTRYGGDCYAYCMLAAGHIDVIVEPGLKTYDIAALIPIIERAGGIVTTWDGASALDGGDIVACGDPALHRQVLKLIAAQ